MFCQQRLSDKDKNLTSDVFEVRKGTRANVGFPWAMIVQYYRQRSFCKD